MDPRNRQWVSCNDNLSLISYFRLEGGQQWIFHPVYSAYKGDIFDIWKKNYFGESFSLSLLDAVSWGSLNPPNTLSGGEVASFLKSLLINAASFGETASNVIILSYLEILSYASIIKTHYRLMDYVFCNFYMGFSDKTSSLSESSLITCNLVPWFLSFFWLSGTPM